MLKNLLAEFDRNSLMHALLAAVHAVKAIVLLAESALLHSACAGAAALAYGLACWVCRNHHGDDGVP